LIWGLFIQVRAHVYLFRSRISPKNGLARDDMAPSQLRRLLINFVGLYGMCWQDRVHYVL